MRLSLNPVSVPNGPIAAALIVGSLFFPVWIYLDISGAVLGVSGAWIVALFIALSPLGWFRQRRQSLRESAAICSRCETPLGDDCELGLYEGQTICPECTATMEDIEGRPLPRVRLPRRRPADDQERDDPPA